MFFNVRENLAIAIATILTEPGKNGGFGEPVGAQESNREAISVVATINKGLIEMIEQLV